MPTPTENANQAQQLLQGFNTMQMQMGLMPGGMPPPPPPPMPPVMHPGQVAGMLAQQSMAMQYMSPHPSAVFGGHQMGFPGAFGASAPPLMGRAAMARQRGIHEAGFPLGMAQAGTGLGLRVGGGIAATAIGTAFGGPIGGLAANFAYEHLGIGQGLQNFGNALFEPIVAQRERALHMQNLSTGFVMGGPQLSMSGQGLSGVASQGLVRGIDRLADNRNFRRETSGMFNRDDLSRITRLSSELGMLDNTQTAEQITREVRKISKALSTFMRVAEEPDVRVAMQQMARMRSMGFTAPETSVAASNARTFARMAGVTVADAMEGAMRGASMYSQYGLSGAAGFQAGLGAQGMARSLASGMDPRRLALAGGVGGIEQTMLGAGAQAATLDMMLPALVTRRNGRLAADPDAIRSMLSGDLTAGGLASRSAANLRRMGPGALQDIFTQRRELQDEISRSLGPQGQMMLPLLQAQMVSRQTGMGMGASLRTLGLSEEQARTLEQAYESPDFMNNIRQQMAISTRERSVDRRDELLGRDTVRGRMRRMYDRTVRRGMSDIADSATAPISQYFADEQDREEAAALQGEGSYRIIRRDRGGSAIQAAQVRDRYRTDRLGMRAGMQRMQGELDARVAAENFEATAFARMGPAGWGARMMHGPDGFGFSTQGRGGSSYRDVVLEGASFSTRAMDYLGMGPGMGAIDEMGRGQEGLARLSEDTVGMTTEQRRRRRRQAFGGFSTSLNAQQRGEMVGAATSAVRDYVSGSRGLFGMRTASGTDTEMKAQVKASLMRQGMSEADANRFISNDAAMGRAIEDARAGMTSEEREALDVMAEQGRTAGEGLLAQSRDQLRAAATSHRDQASELLNLNRLGNASDEDKVAVFDVIGGTGEDAEMRRKVYAAALMQRSSDRDTKARGDALMAQLEEEAAGRGKDEQFENAKAAAYSQLEAMNERDRDQMAEAVSGKSAEQAIALVNQAGERVTRAGEASALEAQQGLLGSRAGRTYARLGGGARAVAELRRNPGQVTDRNIRRMFSEGKSDEEIARAIDSATASRVSSGDGVSSGGAGTSEADRAQGDVAESMAAALEEGRADFPSAVNRFSEASDKLLRAAETLSSQGTVSELLRGAGEGGSGGPGFAPPFMPTWRR